MYNIYISTLCCTKHGPSLLCFSIFKNIIIFISSKIKHIFLFQPINHGISYLIPPLLLIISTTAYDDDNDDDNDIVDMIDLMFHLFPQERILSFFFLRQQRQWWNSVRGWTNTVSKQTTKKFYHCSVFQLCLAYMISLCHH